MWFLGRLSVAILSLWSTSVFSEELCPTTYVPTCDKVMCCGDMGGISYCDSLAGRYVCNNGFYSTCYCTRHAVMDLQKIQGCCLWHGGVLTIDLKTGTVVCNDGAFSEVCSKQPDKPNISIW